MPTKKIRTISEQTTHSGFNEVLFALIGVGIFGIIAGINKGLGRTMIALMVGFLLLFLLFHANLLQDLIARGSGTTKPVVTA